jgi:hypothetical protein
VIRFELSVVLALVGVLATATPQTDTIYKLYRALGTSSPTIATFRELFGGDGEAETDTLLAIYYRGRVPDNALLDEKAVEFTRRANDPKHVSEFLRCISPPSSGTAFFEQHGSHRDAGTNEGRVV